MQKTPVLLDTDIGSDIDDAVALAYLLKHPACDLLGITTVSGEPQLRASLADAICQVAGRTEVPIHVGSPGPLIGPQRQPRAPQAEALGTRWPHAEFAAANTAVEFLRRTIRERPGEITLLTIGPLTNIALLFAIDPEIPTLLRSLVMMGGRFLSKSPEGHLLEWNIMCDPYAAAMVFAAPVPELVAVGLDVTTQCTLGADESRQRFQAAGGPLTPVADMAEVWFRHTNVITFHDPLAAALIFEPGICTYQNHQVDVDLISARSLGHTLAVAGAQERPHKIAATVDSGAFFQHYFDTVSGA
jgi:purine nucleosidase